MSGTYALAVVLAATQLTSRDSLLAEGVRLSAMEPEKALGRFSDALAPWLPGSL